MDDGAPRVSALLELAALQAVHGAENFTVQDELHQQLLDLAASGALEEEAAAAQLGSQALHATLRLHSSSAASEHPGRQQQQQPPLELELRFTLPPAYPSAPSAPPPPPPSPPPQPSPSLQFASSSSEGSAAVAAVRRDAAAVAATATTSTMAANAAARCSVSVRCEGGSGGRRRPTGREWADGLASELERLAQQAALEGRPCLHELCEHAQSALDRLAAEQAGAEAEAGGASAGQQGLAAACLASSSSSSSSEEDLHEVLLIRLDHMHNRALYGRTIGSWIRELRLTGRLIFQGGLILILLEGDGDALREYLVRHRTESVDVDSRGRKCKERMMDVVVQQPLRRPLSSHQEGSGRREQPGASAAGGGGRGDRAFSDFREVQLETLEQVGQLLRRAGLGEWLRPAAGLP
ncbi:hypothetical protein PLESTM_000082000 [Pleodorina starrii]|nr:hypothetical protein PLESTM_000082000 [Pleodorina starrii]